MRVRQWWVLTQIVIAVAVILPDRPDPQLVCEYAALLLPGS
jgi:hypothetical protein